MTASISVAPESLLIVPAGVLHREFSTAGDRPALSLIDPPGIHEALFAPDDLLRITAPGFQDPAAATVSGRFVHKFWLPGGFPVATECDVWLKVLSVVDQNTHFDYQVELLYGPDCRFPAGTIVAHYGQIDEQRILLTSALDGAPYLDIFDVGAAPWTGSAPRVRLGRLDGLPQVAVARYGLAVGALLDDAADAYTIVDEAGLHLHRSATAAADANPAITGMNGSIQTARLSASGRLQVGADIGGDETTALDLNSAENRLVVRARVALTEELRSQGAIALTQDGKMTLLAAPDGTLKLGADTSLPESTGFFYDVTAGTLTLRATTSLIGDARLAGNLTVSAGDTSTARVSSDGSLLLGPDVDQPGGAHFVAGADGALAIGAGRENGAAFEYAPGRDTVTVRATLAASDVAADGSVTVAAGQDGSTQLGAAVEGNGRVRFGTDIATVAKTAFDLDAEAGTLAIRAAAEVTGDLTVEGDLALADGDGQVGASVSRDGRVRFGTDLSTAEGTLFDLDAEAGTLAIRAAAEVTGDLTVKGDLALADGDGQVGASVSRDGRVRFGTDLSTAEGILFDLDAEAGTLAIRAAAQFLGGISTQGDLRLGERDVTKIFLGQNGDVRFGPNVDTPEGTGFFYATASRKLMLTAPLDAQAINATSIEASELSGTTLVATRAAIAEEASVAGTLAIGDEGAFVVGANRNIEIDNRGVTMRLLPGENGSVQVLGIGRAALLNAYQTSDNVQTFDLLAYYNSGIPKLHGSVNLGVADVSGRPSDLYMRLTRYHTGARNAELNASFVDVLSDRIQLRGSVNVRGSFEFSGSSDRVFRLRNLPSSAGGLPSGAVWNDGGTLRIVP